MSNYTYSIFFVKQNFTYIRINSQLFKWLCEIDLGNNEWILNQVQDDKGIVIPAKGLVEKVRKNVILSGMSVLRTSNYRIQ
jgi:hypothetical protein